MARGVGGNIDGEWQTDKVVLLAFVIVLGVVSMVIQGTGSDSGDSDGSDNEVDPYLVMEDGLLHSQPPGHPLGTQTPRQPSSQPLLTFC